MKWPREVEIADNIGVCRFFNGNKPCCAIGHAVAEFRRCGNYVPIEYGGPVFGVRPFRKAYEAVSREFFGVFCQVETANDKSCPETRNLLYNAAWAYLGYTEGQSEEVLDLAKRAKNGTKSA